MSWPKGSLNKKSLKRGVQAQTLSVCVLDVSDQKAQFVS